MGNPLLELQPNQVSKDLSSYITYIYGSPKCGKSTFAAQFPSALFITTEPTNRAIPGIYSIEVDNWSGVRQTVRNLKDDAVREKYKTVIFDTIDLAAEFCERYICNREGVENIKDIPWGAGYGMVEREFEKTIREIHNLQYGLVFISHVKESTFTREDGSEYNKLVPAISSKRCLAIAENFADIYGWAHIVKDQQGQSKPVLTIRQENESVSGGNHFKYIVPEIELSYQALQQAMIDALDKQEQEVGSELFTADKKETVNKQYDFDAEMAIFNDIVTKLQEVGGGAFGTLYAPRIQEIVAKYLGAGKTVTDMSRNQVEQLVLINDELKEWVGNGI